MSQSDGGQQQRQRIEIPRTRLRGAVAVGHRVAVPVDLDVGDAVVVDQAADDRPQLVQSAAPSLAHAFGEFLPGGAHIACRVDEFVVSGAGTFAAHIEQRLLGTRGAVPGQQVVDIGRVRSG